MVQTERTTDGLYRTEAVNANQVSWLGEIVLVRPVSFTVFTAIGTFCGAIVLAFLFMASYTKRTTVYGQLLPEDGLVKVHAPQPGQILERHIKEGDFVRKGQILFSVSGDRLSSMFGETEATLSEHMRQRQTELDSEREKIEMLHRDELKSHQNRVRRLRKQLDQVNEQIALQEKRIHLAEQSLHRFEALESQRFFSRAHVEARQTEVIEQALKLQTLHREQERVIDDLGMVRNELSALPLKHQNQVSQIARERAVIEQERAEREVRRKFIVTAPEGGTITALLANTGKTVDPTMPLASIIPSDSTLVADLYAPTRAVGFVRPNDKVLLRYQAYPYQVFGQYGGTVVSVSKAPLAVSDVAGISGGIPGFDAAHQEQLLYRIVVRLDKQTVQAYGQQIFLHSGMVLEADILRERRRLYEWVLDPIYALRGRITGAPQ